MKNQEKNSYPILPHAPTNTKIKIKICHKMIQVFLFFIRSLLQKPFHHQEPPPTHARRTAREWHTFVLVVYVLAQIVTCCHGTCDLETLPLGSDAEVVALPAADDAHHPIADTLPYVDDVIPSADVNVITQVAGASEMLPASDGAADAASDLTIAVDGAVATHPIAETLARLKQDRPTRVPTHAFEDLTAVMSHTMNWVEQVFGITNVDMMFEGLLSYLHMDLQNLSVAVNGADVAKAKDDLEMPFHARLLQMSSGWMYKVLELVVPPGDGNLAEPISETELAIMVMELSMSMGLP